MESIPSALINKGDNKPIILDIGCYRIATGFRNEFLEGTLVWLCHTHLMGRIGASLEANHEGTPQYGVIKDKGKVSVLKGTGILITDLKYRLLIPQDHFIELQILKNPEGSFNMNWYKSVLEISDQVPIDINYENTTHLPMLNA